MNIESIYDYYKYYGDDKLEKTIVNKAEFNTIIKKEKQNCDINKFELKPNQIFLKNFINNSTPYKSLLLFHGTGTGKTCSAITIAENFKDIFNRPDKRTIIISPKSVINNWKNTIYDSKKGIDQCTNDNYDKLFYTDKYDKNFNLKNEVKKQIKKHYEFFGYRKFSNIIANKLNIDLKNTKNLTTNQQIKIKNIFSNRVLIIDEVHNIRSDDDSKDILVMLKWITKYSKNMKLILLSATPMFNSATEIITILNLMIWNNENKEGVIDTNTLKTTDIFDSENKIKKKGLELIKNKISGYVSYVKGENKETFPERLYPKTIIKTYPNYNYKNERLNDTNKIINLKLYGNKLQNNYNIDNVEIKLSQTDIYYRELQKIIEKDNLQIGDEIKFMQLSNMAYPSTKNFIGKIGLKTIMDIDYIDNNIRFSYKKSILNKIGPIFDNKLIQNYSIKIKNIINIIKQSKGIIFIYSQYVYGGIIPLLLALEHEGFHKFNSPNLLNYKHTSKVNLGNYIVLSANTDISKNNETDILAVKSENNMNGENIKIIIGSSIASEGIDFKYIRQVHIMDPWHHLNRLEQIIGRGIRYCSHESLPLQDRNVTIYNHVLETFDNKNETIDMHIYNNAEKKSIEIKYIEEILKEKSIDCNLFKHINKTNCDSKIVEKKFKNYDTFDKNLFKPVLYKICNLIKDLYKLKYSYTLNEIINELLKHIDCDVKYIYLALNLMINETNLNTLIKIDSSEGESQGYLKYVGNNYIFNPINNKKNDIPFTYRYNKITIKNKSKYIDKKELLTKKKGIPSPKSIDISESDTLVIDTTELDEYFNINKQGKNFIINFDENILKYYVLERFPIVLKIQNLSKLLVKINSNETLTNEEEILYEFFNRNLIYKGEDINKEFEFVMDIIDLYPDYKKLKPIGFYLMTKINNKDKFNYFLLEDTKIIQISEDSEKIDLIKDYWNWYINTDYYILRYLNLNQPWSYIYLNSKNKYIFKLVNKTKLGYNSVPGSRIKGHLDCNGQHIGDITDEYIVNTIDKKYYESSNIFSKNIKRKYKCIFIELLFRKLNTISKQPFIYNYDNVFLIDLKKYI